MGKIELTNITKRFGELVAVDELNVSFTEGAYTMILGPSGCGKSTTLRMIAGLEAPTEGEIRIDGEVVTDQPAKDREISMVFQSLALWNHKTVSENMGFGLKMEGVGTEERRARVTEIAELLQIDDKLDENPASLSGGQQQRVALGRSLVREPEVVLLDEPLSSLDAKLRLEMRTELSRIQQELGTTFIHVTHNQEDAMTVADDILLLDDGRVQQFGPALDVYHEPANEFVADFIGTPSINLFDATADARGDAFVFDAGSFEIPLSGERADALERAIPAGEVRLGIRPESLLVGASGDWPTFEATVDIVETFGDHNWYHLEPGDGTDIVLKSANDEVLRSVAEGAEITVSLDPDAIHVFDPASGEALV